MDQVLADTLTANLKAAETTDQKVNALVLAEIAVVDCQRKTSERVKKLVADKAAMTNNIAPLKARLDAQRERPVATIFMTAGPNAALDRQNLTFVALSNEVKRVSDGLDIHQWVFSSSILRSDPIMECDITTPGGTAYGGEFVWDAYGTNAVTIVDHGEEYECYKMTCHIKTSATNLNVYVNPWTHIARRGQMFNFGNRKMRINRVYACTTNNLSWCGRFTTTNQVAIPYVPYADKGRFFWTEKEDQ